MHDYTSSTRVAVYPFTRQPSGDDVIVGRPDVSAFLVLGRDIIQVLDDLAAGMTLGETAALYEERHGEKPDLIDFVADMHRRGFLAPLENDQTPADIFPAISAQVHGPTKGGRIVDKLAHALFGRPAVAFWAALIVLALSILCREPALIPSRSALFFPKHMTFFSATLLCFSLSTALIHELAHFLAARAVGVSARIGLGHRLWVLVAETDISGIWALPKSKRYLPILAGPLIDATSAAVIVLTLYAAGEAWRADHPMQAKFLQALMLSYALRLVWQCYLFIRTDFYYALIMLMDCKDLMSDTESYLMNKARRLVGLEPKVDQSHIPARERRVIGWFTVPFLVGRCLAFAVLIFIQLPILAAYLSQVIHNLSGGYKARGGDFVDSVILGSIGITFFFAGMFLWIKSLVQKRRTPHGAAELIAQ